MDLGAEPREGDGLDDAARGQLANEVAGLPAEVEAALFAGRRFANLNHRLVVDIRVGHEDEPKAPTAER